MDDAEYLQDDHVCEDVFDVVDRRCGVVTPVAPHWALTVARVGQDIPVGHQVTTAGQTQLLN